MKKKKNGLLQTFFYDFLKIQVTNWVREILVTCENQSSIIYWFLLRYTVIIYKFTQGNLGTKKIASSRFQSPVKKKNRKLRHWRPTARSLVVPLFFHGVGVPCVPLSMECVPLSMGHVPLYPWVVSLFIHGSCPSLSMGHVPLYPWFVSLFIHGSCPSIHGLFLSLSMGLVPLYPCFVSLFFHGLCPSLSMGGVPLYP